MSGRILVEAWHDRTSEKHHFQFPPHGELHHIRFVQKDPVEPVSNLECSAKYGHQATWRLRTATATDPSLRGYEIRDMQTMVRQLHFPTPIPDG
jgi:hypothetical protein